MAETQSQKISPPRPEDSSLDDYSAILQDNFRQLFELSHTHRVRTTPPTSNEGDVGDIYLISTSSEKYIAVKFSNGWFRSAALTAL